MSLFLLKVLLTHATVKPTQLMYFPTSMDAFYDAPNAQGQVECLFYVLRFQEPVTH